MEDDHIMETVKLMVGLAGMVVAIAFGVSILLNRNNEVEAINIWLLAIGSAMMTWGLWL